jgi:hypothetical protein
LGQKEKLATFYYLNYHGANNIIVSHILIKNLILFLKTKGIKVNGCKSDSS